MLFWDLASSQRLLQSSKLPFCPITARQAIGCGTVATVCPRVLISGTMLTAEPVTMWTILESCAGIIGGNLPCLKPLARGVLGSTYGRGSRSKTIGTGATPRYPYLSRTSNTLAAKSQGFNSLTSSKAGNHTHDPYDAYMMTSVGPGKEGGRAESAASVRDDERSDKGSEGSVELLDTQGASMKLGGILKTTEVTQTTFEERTFSPSPSSRAGAQEDLRPKRDVRDMV